MDENEISQKRLWLSCHLRAFERQYDNAEEEHHVSLIKWGGIKVI
jgi:hypothetical protein